MTDQTMPPLPERANLPPQIGRLLKPGQRSGQPVYSAYQMRAFYAAGLARGRAEAPSDEVIQLAEALQVRRILEEIKAVAAIHQADDMPTPFQSAWQACCEEIFFRATGCEWHMSEDAERFKANAALRGEKG